MALLSGTARMIFLAPVVHFRSQTMAEMVPSVWRTTQITFPVPTKSQLIQTARQLWWLSFLQQLRTVTSTGIVHVMSSVITGYQTAAAKLNTHLETATVSVSLGSLGSHSTKLFKAMVVTPDSRIVTDHLTILCINTRLIGRKTMAVFSFHLKVLFLKFLTQQVICKKYPNVFLTTLSRIFHQHEWVQLHVSFWWKHR